MRRTALLLGCLLLWPTSAVATVLLDWGLDELARRSDRVVIGTIESQTTVPYERTLMTDTKIRVARTLAGKSEAVIIVRQLGGRLGRRIVDVPGDAVLEVGKTYVLFTAQPKDDAHRYLVGMSLGAIERTAQGTWAQTITVPLLSSSGAQREAPGRRAITLEAIERAVRQ